MTLLWIDEDGNEIVPAAIKLGTITYADSSEVPLTLTDIGNSVYELGSNTSTGTATQ